MKDAYMCSIIVRRQKYNNIKLRLVATAENFEDFQVFTNLYTYSSLSVCVYVGKNEVFS